GLDIEICLGFGNWDLELLAYGYRVASHHSQSWISDHRLGGISHASPWRPGLAGLSIARDPRRPRRRGNAADANGHRFARDDGRDAHKTRPGELCVGRAIGFCAFCETARS